MRGHGVLMDGCSGAADRCVPVQGLSCQDGLREGLLVSSSILRPMVMVVAAVVSSSLGDFYERVCGDFW